MTRPEGEDQWAMVRYYLTPAVFDSLNTRELPRSFTLVASLIGGGVGLAGALGLEGQGALGLDPAVVAAGASIATGAAAGVAGNATLNRVQDFRDRRSKPWAVTIDELSTHERLKG